MRGVGERDGTMSQEAMRYDSAPQRRRVIMERLRETGFVSVTSLTRDLGVSDMTVRRDLRKLEKQGSVRVVHGGVSALHGPMHNPAFVSRSRMDEAANKAIAETALGLVADKDTIAIDAGTTTYALAQALPHGFDGTVVTHSVPVIQLLLSRGRGKVVGLGGELLHELFQLRHAAFGGADGHAVLAARIAAGLAGIQPVLKRAGQQAVRDIPEVRVRVAVGQAVAEVYCLGEGRIESVRDLSHGAGV